MKLSEDQLKNFQRIHKKHPVSLEYLKYNFSKIIKELKYFTSLRFIIKRKLIRRKNLIFLQYNVPSKQILSLNKRRTNKNRKSSKLTWSKKVVMYNKKIHLFDKIKQQTNEVSNSDSQNDIELNLTPDEIQIQLKTQLELLKGGKRCQPSSSNNASSAGTITLKLFTSNSNITKRLSLDRKSSFGGGGSSCSSFDISLKDAKEAGPSNQKRIYDDLFDSSSSVEQFNDFISKSNNSIINKNDTINSLNNYENNAKSSEDIEPVKKQTKPSNFIDSLINKINSTKDKSSDGKNLNESDKLRINLHKNNLLTEKSKNFQQSEEDSLSSGEFLGFPDVEIIQPDIPGMLPTPVVPRKLGCTQSAFVSEDLDKFMRDNLLDKNTDNTIDNIPKSMRFEDGLVYKGAVPPKLKMAALPTELAKPRTVAEKRIMLQKNKNIKYLMIENENTIYHELKKRSRDCNANKQLIKALQKQVIPATRDFWKATSWLLTENGNFYFQILNIDGVECKLIGGYGNNLNKILPYQFSCPMKKDLKRLTCSKNCIDNNSFKNIKIRYNIKKENHKINLVPNINKTNNNNYKPGPLSSKCLHLSYMPNHGPPEIYRMPKIQLEVFPQINRPLDDVCKSYLKMILPSKNITKEWAEFAVSTLIPPKTQEEFTKNTNYKSYTFNIPYLNDQKKILVRRIYNRKEKFDKITTNDLQFRKFANKSRDPITLECANILSEMIDSVAIGLSEDSLIKDDPDIDYVNKTIENANLKTADNIIKPSGNVNSDKKADKKINKKSGNSKSKLMLELKRLNATIIDAGGSVYEEEEVKEVCTKAYCRLGCVCMSLSGQPSLKKHCKNIDCMIECNCIAGLVEPEDSVSYLSGLVELEYSNSCITSQDALMLRKKATARLAKMEREFCSTVVLTNTETLLINESQYERKRRCTKRYSNYAYKSESEHSNINNTKDDSLEQPPNKRQRTANKMKTPVTEAKLSELDYLVYVDEITMEKLKHCQVSLCKLEYLENIEKWCMIHCLYKCFCNGNDITGKPFVLKKDEVNDKEEIVYSRKPKYSFDTNEESITTTQQLKVGASNKIEKRKFSPSDKLKSNNSNTKIIKPLIVNDKRNEDLLKERILIRKYFELDDNYCRRILPIPSTYSSRNKRYVINKTRSTKFKNFKENSETNKLLIELIRNSILYKPTRIIPTDKNKSNNNKNENESKFLKISSVVSLNPSPTRNISQNIQQNSIMLLQQKPIISTNTDLLQTAPTDFKNTIASQDIHKNVLKLLNYLVTKTMHNICKIQVDESKNIPNPVAESLHISQWRYFLQAYIEGIIHIWEVKVDDKIYFTGTMQNIMPFIHNAISVVNIKAIRKENLPLFGKMLNAKVINQQTSSLSILMAGHNDYWRILGMTKSTIDYLTQGGVIKPTPQSHPWLSTKINTLYEIMAKNRIDKILTQQQKSSNNHNSNDKINKNSILNNNNDEQLDRLLQMNIKIRQLTEREIIQDKFTIPLGSCSSILDYRWLVLDIVDDFSHILFVEQMECLTHNKIKIAFQRSFEEKKMVRLAKVDGKNIDCYVMKKDKDRIYLGPFQLNGNPQIVLYQNIDGKMLLREDFEKVQNIKRNVSTTGFWLCRKNGKIIFDIKTKEKSIASTSINSTAVQQSHSENTQHTNEQCKFLSTDDTIIIDQDTDLDENSNDSSSTIKNQSTHLQIYEEQTLNKDSNKLQPLEKINTNDINLTTTVTAPNNNTNSQTFQTTMTKIPNNKIVFKSPLFNTYSKTINNSTTNINNNNDLIKNNKIKQIILNTSENNSNQTGEKGLISLNPGFYEINCFENQNETIQKSITTSNCTFITSTKSSSDNSLISCSKRTDPILINKISSWKKSEKKTDHKLMPGETLKNKMVAQKLTSSVLNPIAINSKNIPRPILPKVSVTSSTNKSNDKSINDFPKILSSQATNDSKVVVGIDQSKEITLFNNTTSEIISTDSTKAPIITNVYSIPKVPSFIKISPVKNLVNTIVSSSTLSSQLRKSDNFPKNKTAVRTNTITTDSLSKLQISPNLGGITKKPISDLNKDRDQSSRYPKKKNESFTNNVVTSVEQNSSDISAINSTRNGQLINSTTADIKRPRTITGFFVSNISDYPKFGGMKREPNYLIKSSINSALQLKDLNEVARFLNGHVRKHSPAFKADYKNVIWSFVPYKKTKNSPQMAKNSLKQFQETTFNTINSNGKRSLKTNETDEKQPTVLNDVIVIDDED